MQTQFTQQQIQDEINSAAKVIAKATRTGLVAVITESRLSASARKSWLGFHFAKESEVPQIGTEETLYDGSVRKALYLVY